MSSDAPPSYSQASNDKSPLIATAPPVAAGATYGSSPQGQPVTVIYQPQQQYGFDTQLEHQRKLATTIKWLRYVPAMHICPAIFFFSLNCLIPGLGTIIASFSVCCCANTVLTTDSMSKILCITFWFGLLQLITLPIVFGYILAMLWSYGTVFNYRLYYKQQLDPSEIIQPNQPGR